MSDCWETARGTLKLTTTNVVADELRTHIRNAPNHTFEGSRDHRRKHGSQRALDALDDDATNFTTVTSVPRPSGEDAGERSLQQEIDENPGVYRYIVLNDSRYRDRFRDRVADQGSSYTVAPPTFLLYFLYDNDEISKANFCTSCENMMRGEGWTSQGAVYEMWREIPVDCEGYVSEDLLP